MVHFGESDKMIKIIEKVDKSDSYNGFSNIEFFIHWTSSDKTLVEKFKKIFSLKVWWE